VPVNPRGTPRASGCFSPTVIMSEWRWQHFERDRSRFQEQTVKSDIEFLPRPRQRLSPGPHWLRLSPAELAPVLAAPNSRSRRTCTGGLGRRPGSLTVEVFPAFVATNELRYPPPRPSTSTTAAWTETDTPVSVMTTECAVTNEGPLRALAATGRLSTGSAVGGPGFCGYASARAHEESKIVQIKET
jgi:hypothetical protein